jgi:hypothetical protein
LLFDTFSTETWFITGTGLIKNCCLVALDWLSWWVSLNECNVVNKFNECNIHSTTIIYLYKGYSMLMDEFGIYFTSEPGFIIFLRVRTTSSENIIKILSHEWNKLHIHQQSIEFSVYYIFFAFETCLFQIWMVLEQWHTA